MYVNMYEYLHSLSQDVVSGDPRRLGPPPSLHLAAHTHLHRASDSDRRRHGAHTVPAGGSETPG